LKNAALAFQKPRPRQSVGQLVSTLGPLLILLAAMHVALAYGWWPALLLAVPAAGLIVRTFILQHDCGHGSLFRSRRTNDWIGRVCSLITWTPYGHWQRQHAQHHAQWNNLDHRDRGVDIYSDCETLAEYRRMTPWARWRFRMVRHPLVSLLLLPPLIFFVFYRFPFDSPPTWRRERHSVYLTNLALLAVYAPLCFLVGFWHVAIVLSAVMIPTSIAGVWLFSIQHRFEGVHWMRSAEWDALTASIEGSSFLALPRLLQWFTGSIGFHHIHHLAPRVPNYSLEACHFSNPGFAARVRTLTLRECLFARPLPLWDEAEQRMIGFTEAFDRSPDRVEKVARKDGA